MAVSSVEQELSVTDYFQQIGSCNIFYISLLGVSITKNLVLFIVFKCILYNMFLGVLSGFFWHLYTIIAFNTEKSCCPTIHIYEFS